MLAELAELETRQRELQKELASIETIAPRVLPALNMAEIAEIITSKLYSAPPHEVAQVLRGFVIRIEAVKPARQPLTGRMVYRLPGSTVGEFVVSL